MDKTEGKFGANRNVLRAQYNRLPSMVKHYVKDGRLDEANDLLKLLVDAPLFLVREADVDWARGEIERIKGAAVSQKDQAALLIEAIQAARAMIEGGGDLIEALDATDKALKDAAAANLVATHLSAIAKAESVTVTKQAQAAIEKKHQTLNAAVDASLTIACGNDAARRAKAAAAGKPTLDAAEGRIMIGSSTELQYTVPLANFLAMRERVLEYRY